MRTISALIVLSLACSSRAQSGQPTVRTIGNSFPPPAGFTREPVVPGSFGSYLRSLSLKPAGTPVHLFNGELKPRQDAHAAVIDISTGKADLQQCADAVMRLRAEYLFANGQADAIAFDLTSGFRADWKRWRNGGRIKVSGNTCRWTDTAKPDASHDQLLRFLEMVFTYAGSLSLQRELDRTKPPGPLSAAVNVGDVFIHGGSPGHAMIVVDVARSKDGHYVFLLAQSYMPAQDMHVVKNDQYPSLGAWFLLGQDERLFTPEWTFEWTDRRCW